jgi:hypothetical protein
LFTRCFAVFWSRSRFLNDSARSLNCELRRSLIGSLRSKDVSELGGWTDEADRAEVGDKNDVRKGELFVGAGDGYTWYDFEGETDSAAGFGELVTDDGDDGCLYLNCGLARRGGIVRCSFLCELAVPVLI